MRLPGRNDILDYVENSSGQEVEVQKRIMHLLASSQLLREHMAELKRDLYLVSSQIPDYSPDAAFGAELLKLSQSWIQVIYARKFSIRNFHRSKEFYGLILALCGFTLLLLGLLGFRLLKP